MGITRNIIRHFPVTGTSVYDPLVGEWLPLLIDVSNARGAAKPVLTAE